MEAGAPRVLPEGGHRAASTRRADQPTLADLSLPAEVALDRIPDLLGEIERLRAVRWARLTAKERSAYSGNADSRSFTSRVPRSAATCTSAFQARLLGRT